MPNDYYDTITIRDIPIKILCQMTIMILSLLEISLSRYYHYQGSNIKMHHDTITISKSHSILMNFIDFIKLDYL